MSPREDLVVLGRSMTAEQLSRRLDSGPDELERDILLVSFLEGAAEDEEQRARQAHGSSHPGARRHAGWYAAAAANLRDVVVKIGGAT